MSSNRAAYSFIVLGVVSLIGGIACLGWASSLGGYRFLGATAAIFLAMLSFIKFDALRRPRVADRPVPMPDSKYQSIRAPIVPGVREMEDAELTAKLMALRIRRQQAEELPVAPPEREPDPAVTVIEGEPLDSAAAPLFAASDVAPLPEPDPPREMSSAGLRQMDELRAEIARLREGARLRHAGFAAGGGGDPFARTEFSGLPGQPSPVEAPEPAETFARTEFTGLGAGPEEGSGFTKTEYLGPVELRR